MPDPRNEAELRSRFEAQATDALPRAPLNAALCRLIADQPSLTRLLGHAPAAQQLPMLMLAALHFLLIDDADQPLAAWYPSLTTDHRSPSDAELAPTLEAFVRERERELIEIMRSRRVQTNEVGRSACLMAAFSMIATRAGPLSHIDVGASAGLNTLANRFSYRYDDDPPFGAPSSIEIACSTRGDGPVPTSIPTIARAIGLDSEPVSLDDPSDARWLEACCWPDQSDRFARLRAAIAMALEHRPDVRRGDAVDAVGDLVAECSETGHPVLTTTWVLNYLTPQRRRAFVDRLDQIGAQQDLSWVMAESPAVTPELPHANQVAGKHRTALAVVSWRSGKRRVRHLGTCHPHGYWIHWR